MVFSSVLFLEYFLPPVLILYFLVLLLPMSGVARRRAGNFVLLTSSVIFYACGGIIYVALLAGVLLLNYLSGLLISRSERLRKLILVITVLLDFGILFVFKYLNLTVIILENLTAGSPVKEALTGILTLNGTGRMSIPYIVLPIGISFYIFQAVSYVADVYREDAKCQKNFLDFSLYISFFPQLIAGPIVQYSDIEAQLMDRRESAELFSSGITRFIYGLAKKVLIANTLAQVIDSILALEIKGLGASVTWLGAVCYTLQIYYDFSGYSDMAIGLGRMFGFSFKENFNYPYSSRSIREFWERWHLSLSEWFKQYVYFPLGGSRVSKGKAIRNIFIIFLLTGIWHGANFTYFAWGLLNGVLVIVERLFLGKFLKKAHVFNRIYTLFFVFISMMVFRSDNILLAFDYIREMFSKGAGEYTVLSFLSMKRLAALLVGAVFSFPIYTKVSEKTKSSVAAIIFRTILFIVSLLAVFNGSYNPFLYFQF